MRLSADPLLFAIALIVFFLLPSAAKAEFYPAERDALLCLRDSLHSPLRSLHSLWTGPPCDQSRSRWKGIKCSDGHVTHLVLEALKLTGPLPPDCLLNLSFLTKLSFRNNSISGSLPQLHGLHHLRFVSFAENRFSGHIPFEYVGIENLKELEVQDNSLTGEIPPFDQQNLVGFNVSDNLLEGRIPETAVLQRFSEDSFRNNPGLCGWPLKNYPCPLPSPPPAPPAGTPRSRPLQPKNWVKTIVLSVIVLFLLALLGLILRHSLTRHKDRRQGEEDDGVTARNIIAELLMNTPGTSSMNDSGETSRSKPNGRDSELRFFDDKKAGFDLHDLLISAADVLGQGTTGTSYKAMLQSGLVVAVKRLKVDAVDGTGKDFLHHMQRIGSLKHENVAEMVAFCHSKEQMLLLYDYVPGGCLFQRLHESRGPGRVPLRWNTRLRVVKGVARGLAFLHEAVKLPHANLKSTNILLDTAEAHPKLTHYGFEPILSRRLAADSLAAARSPEFARGKKFTFKSDVWCFGIVLLEVITGRIPAELSSLLQSVMTPCSVPWPERAWSALSQGWSFDVLDLEILPDKKQHANMMSFVEIALKCTAPVPDHRPDMTEIVGMIEEIEHEEGFQEEEEEVEEN